MESVTERNRRLSSRELLLIFIFWTLLAVLSSVNRILDPRGFGFRMSPTAPVAMAFIESWVWAAFTPLIFWLSSRFGPERSKWIVHVPLLILVGLVVAVIVHLALQFARFEIFEMTTRRGG